MKGIKTLKNIALLGALGWLTINGISLLSPQELNKIYKKDPIRKASLLNTVQKATNSIPGKIILPVLNYRINKFTKGHSNQISCSGKGSQKHIGPFNMDKGLYNLMFENYGNQDFNIRDIHLLNLDKTEVEILDGWRHKMGSKVLHLKKGLYFLNVEASSDWKIETAKIDLQDLDDKVNETEVINSRDTGIKSIGPMKLAEGLYKFECKGNWNEGNFIGKLYREGKYIDLIFNETDYRKGSKIVKLDKEGIYFLNIHAEDLWHIKGTKIDLQNLEGAIEEEGDTISFKGSQERNKGIGPLKLIKGMYTFTGKTTTDGNFIVKLLNQKGKYDDLLFNEIGPSQYLKIINIKEEGPYFLTVEDSDGDWEINLEHIDPQQLKSIEDVFVVF